MARNVQFQDKKGDSPKTRKVGYETRVSLDAKLRTIGLCKIFENVSVDVLKQISRQLQPVVFRKGEIIFNEGDSASAFFIVHEGIVKLYKTALNGKQFVFSIATKGDTLNASALSLGRYFLTAEPLVETILLKLDSSDFFSLLFYVHPIISNNIIKILAKRLDFEYERVLETISGDALKRIIHALWALYHKFGTTIPVTRQCLAEFSGTTVETCIRVLSKLKREKIIIEDTQKRAQIKIYSPNKLREYLGV